VGIPGVSENITVRSIVGNFLEHARVFYFENAGKPEMFCASADWMPRNLERRVEILFPVEAKELTERLRHILDTELRDNLKAYFLQPDGSYAKLDKRGKVPFGSQDAFCEEALEKKNTHQKDVKNTRVFVPETNPAK
jgi:polyphosphate kinase